MKFRFIGVRVLFLQIFIAIIFIVAFLFIHKIDYKSEISKENRLLAKFPTIDNATDIANFPKGFESWLNDRFGYRYELIKIYRGFLYNVFNELAPNARMSGYEDIVLGSRGYIFHPGIRNVLNINGCSDNYAQAKSPIIDSIIGRIEELDLKVIFSIIPRHELFVFEKLPNYIKIEVDKKDIERPYQLNIFQYLKEKNRDNFIFPFEEMKKLSEKSAIYPTANFHQAAKSPATFLYTSLIAEAFGKGKIEYPNLDNFTTPCEKHSDFSILAGILVKNEPFFCSDIDYNAAYGVDVLDTSELFAKMILPITNVEDNFSKNYIHPEIPITYLKNKTQSGKLLVFGNSFSAPILPDLAKYFGEVLRLHIDDVVNKPTAAFDIISVYKPESILFADSSEEAASKVVDILQKIQK